MPFNGSGTYNPIGTPDFPAVPGTTVRSAQYNNQILDMAVALSLCITRDGQSVPTVNLPMGGFKLIGLGAPSDAGDSLRQAQIRQGADIASATMITIPVEGSMFSVTGTTQIDSIAASFLGRAVWLKFSSSLTIKNSSSLILPSGIDFITQANDYLFFIYESAGVWRCILQSNLLQKSTAQWYGHAICEPFPLWDHIPGCPLPPTDNPDFRYIKLTAASAYNTGILTAETVTGVFPTITATAKIALTGSPIDGQTVNLINTTEVFLRSNVAPGVVVNGRNFSHFHTGVTTTTGAHSHNFGPAIGPGGSAAGASGASYTLFGTTTTNGDHAHTLLIDSEGAADGHPRFIGASFYMRIK